MGNECSIVFAGIAPHPPIMVPEVGRESIKNVRGSIDAMAEMAKRIISSGAETILLISPHAPLEAQAFVAYQGSPLCADFANFRAPKVQFEVPLDEELLESIRSVAASENYDVVSIDGDHLDHGTAVPLYFLRHNGWNGAVVALGYSFLSNEDHLRFGSCVGKAIDELGRSVAIVASGDLSHRLTLDAPAGYNPTAYIFDDEVVDALRSNSPERIVKIDQDLRRVAGECGYRSMLVAIGATRELPLACEVLHYEAPFGVGYLVAQLTYNKSRNNREQQPTAADTEAGSDPTEGKHLPALARTAIENFVLSGKRMDPPSNALGLLAARAACFVSLKTLDGQLRGCIGTIEPIKETLAEELIANAINAATRDPRFLPVSADELPNLRYSVDVLSVAEPTELTDLDPSIYGVIVEDETGLHRGLLLPDIEGIDTVERQVEIAARKAGISPETTLKLWRFRVNRFSEELRANLPGQ
jgi:AmmeMemoRadiSam system protein A/AmmeMemoRadiSam system protein B